MWRGFLQVTLGLRYISRLDSKPLRCECEMLVESKELFHAANFKEDTLTSSLSEEEQSQVLNVFFFMTEDDNDHDNFDLLNDDEEANGDGGVPSSFINDHDNSGEGGDGDWSWGLAHLWVSDPIIFSSA